jgi:hypothetical protein
MQEDVGEESLKGQNTRCKSSSSSSSRIYGTVEYGNE